MTFPTIPTGGRLLSTVQANTTATRSFPNFSGLTFGAGDLLVAIAIAYQSSVTNAAFSGWGQSFLERHDSSSSTTMAIGVATKVASGSESGALTVTQAATITGHCALFLFSIPAGTFDPSKPPEFSIRASGTTAPLDIPSLAPSWGAADTLWVEIGGSGETGTGGSYTGLTSASTSYTGYVESGISADAVGGVDGGVAFRQLNTATEDPASMSTDVSNARWAGLLMAIAPVPPASSPPVANAGTDQTVGTGSVVTLDGTGSTDDVAIVSWLWEQLGIGGAVDVATVAQAGNDAGFNVSVPAGTVDGDLLIAAAGSDFGTLAANGLPTGFTPLTTATYDGGSNLMHLAIGYREASSEPASYAFPVSGSDNAGVILRITNHDPAIIIVEASPNAADVGKTAPSLTPTGVDDLLLTFHCGETSGGSAITWTPPSGMTERADVQSNTWTSLEVNSLQAPSSPSGTKVATSSPSGLARGVAVSISIKAAPGGGAVTLSGASTNTATFTAPAEPGVLTFQLTVTDADAQSDTDTVVITVEEAPNSGAASASYSWGLAAEGVQPGGPQEGSAATSYTWSLAATAEVIHEGAGVAAYAWTTHATSVFSLPFVTDISANGRYLIDQNSNPIIPLFDTIWPMVQQAGNTARNGGSATYQQDMDFWVSTRASQGWNALKFTMLGQAVNGAPNDDSRTWDSIWPFGSSGSGSSGANPSSGFIEAYWQRLDYLIDTAAAAGLTCFIHIFYADDVDSGSMSGKATSEYQTFGTFIGNRYKSKPNIVWVIGGDYFDTARTQIQAMVTNLRATGDSHLLTVQNWANQASNDWTTSRKDNTGATQLLGTAIADVNASYIYDPTYLSAAAAWVETPTIPNIWYDGYYDQGTGDQLQQRRYVGWSLSYGQWGCQYGDEGMWSQPSGWRGKVSSPDATVIQIIVMRDAIAGIPKWQDVVPDLSSSFITAGRGSANTFVTGGITADGSLAIIYMPVASTAITVDTAQMGSGYTVSWLDPISGAVTAGTPGTSFSKGNNSGGSTDWFLVLQAGTPEGIATTSYDWNLSAEAQTDHQGIASTTDHWSLTATGDQPPNTGAASATYHWVLAGNGSSDHEAHAEISYDWNAVAVGDQPVIIGHSGAATTSYDWNLVADAENVHEGVSGASYTWGVVAVGDQPTVGLNEGAASTSYHWGVVAEGQTNHEGQFTATFTFILTAHGDEPPNTGLGSASYTWGLSGTAITDRAGEAVTSYDWNAVAVGDQPSIGVHSGAASTSHHWTIVSTGEVAHDGVATVSYIFAAGAIGDQPAIGGHAGAASASYSWTTDAWSETPHNAVTETSHSWDAEASAEVDHQGQATCVWTFVLDARGHDPSSVGVIQAFVAGLWRDVEMLGVGMDGVVVPCEVANV